MGLRNRLQRALAPIIYADRRALVPPNQTHQWAQRQFLRRFLRRLEVDCLLDVGANVGQYGEELRAIGYRGLILSFEPDPNIFEPLKARAEADGRWHAFNMALGSHDGEAEFNLMKVALFNSFRMPSAADTDSYSAANTVERVITVPVKTLGNLLPELQQRFGFTTPFLKMDTQGFDVEVFRGAAAVHDRIAGLQSEVSIKRLYADTPDWREVISGYEAAGFELAGLYPVNPHLDDLTEFDCYMRRNGAGGA